MSVSMSWEVLSRRNIPWREFIALEKTLQERLKLDDDTAYLLIGEPEATLTAGRAALSTDLLLTPEALKNQGITVEPVSRGGKWTYHGPGQIVIFPIVKLETIGLHSKAARVFVETLRQAVQKGLKDLGVETVPGETPFGLYRNEKKLASFGLEFHGGVSGHGVAVYLTDQTQGFQAIHPCGTPGQGATFLQAEQPEITWEAAAMALVRSIKRCFQLA